MKSTLSIASTVLACSLFSAAATAAAAAAATAPPPSFEAWRALHGRRYASPAAAAAARRAFYANAARVEAHNADAAQTHTLGLNEFADLTAADFAALVVLAPAGPAAAAAPHPSATAPSELPSAVDWVARGFVAPVANSGQCGSLALSFADAVTSAAGILDGKLTVRYGGEQIAACDGCGCSGCLMSAPWTWALKHGMTANFTGSCAYAASLLVTHENDVQPANTTALMAALVEAPVLVAINLAALQLYKGGIVRSGCGPSVDSVVMAVGYGVENKDAFFRVKNYWGADWGEKGYARIGRNVPGEDGNGVCGILTSPAWPTVRHA